MRQALTDAAAGMAGGGLPARLRQSCLCSAAAAAPPQLSCRPLGAGRSPACGPPRAAPRPSHLGIRRPCPPLARSPTAGGAAPRLVEPRHSRLRRCGTPGAAALQ